MIKYRVGETFAEVDCTLIMHESVLILWKYILRYLEINYMEKEGKRGRMNVCSERMSVYAGSKWQMMEQTGKRLTIG